MPNAPTGLTITPGDASIILSWQDNSDNETGFAIYRKASALSTQAAGDGSDFVELDTVPADTTTYEDKAVVDDVLYQYGISALGSGGDSGLSQPENGTPVQTVNEPPVADDLSLATAEDTAVAFTLTGSDPEGKALTYTVMSAPAHGTLSGTAPQLSYTPNPNFNGADTLEFSVNDGKHDSAPATVTLTVGATNDAPVATDIIVSTTEDVAVAIALNASDADGDTLSYEIVGNPSFGSLSGTGASRTYTPKADYTGSDSFVYRVNDGTVNSNTANVIITVKGEGDAPVAKSQSVTTNEDTSVSIVLAGSDADGDELSFSLVSAPTHGTLSGSLPNLLYAPDADFNGGDSLTFTVSDGAQVSAAATVLIVVNAVADAPKFGSAPITGATQDVAYSYSVTATDADPGDTLTLTATTKPLWLTFTDNGGGSASLAGTPGNAEVGNHAVVLKVTDAAGASATQSFTVMVSNDNDVPIFTSTPITTVDEDGLYSYSIGASDADVSDAIKFNTATDLPSWLTLTDYGNKTAVLKGTPRNADVGTYQIELRATDVAGAAATQSFTVTVVNTNDAPTVSAPIADRNTDEDILFSLDVSGAFADVDAGDVLTFSASGMPKSLGLDSETGIISGTPGNADVASYTVTVTADDGNGGSVSDEFTLTVVNVNDAPTSTAIDAQSATEDSAFSLDVSGNFDDIDGDTLSYSVSGLDVLSISAGGVIGGTPTNDEVGGPYTITVTADDGNGETVDASFDLTVVNTNDAPTFSSDPITGATQDVAYSYGVTAGDVDALDTLTITATSKPAWLTLTDNGGGSATLSGTPSNAEVGDHTVELEVKDAAGASATQSFTVTVSNDNDAPTFTSEPITTATEGAEYSYDVTATDPDTGDTLSITGETLPSWLALIDNLHGTATLIGTPGNDDVGDNAVELRVTDAAGAADTQSFTITVNNTNNAPTAEAVAVSASEDGDPVVGTFAGADIDSNDSLTYAIFTGLAETGEGSVVNIDNDNGTFTYDPGADFQSLAVGEEQAVSFTYKATDAAEADSNAATVTVTVTGVNDAPTATNPDPQSVAQDNLFSLNVDGNFDDVDGDSLSYSVAGLAALSIDGEGRILGLPDSDDVGEHEITVTAIDGNGGSVQATFTLTVTNVNDNPSFTSTPVTSVLEDATYAYAITATDPDGTASLEVGFLQKPDWLTLTDNGNGSASLSGTPTNDAVGNHPVKLVVNDDGGEADVQSFTVTVVNTNDSPVIDQGDSTAVTMDEDGEPASVSLSATDVDVGDNLSWSIVTTDPATPSHGEASVDVVDGVAVVTYTPAANYYGSDSFTVQVSDGYAGPVDELNSSPTDTITVNVTIDALPDPPVAVDDSFEVDEDTELTGNVITNLNKLEEADSDPDGDTLAVVDGDTDTLEIIDPVSGPSNGTLTLAADGSFSYTPEQDFVGEDSFVYQITDAEVDGQTDTATVTITVNAVNDAPVITDDLGEPYGDSTDITMSEDGKDAEGVDDAFVLTLYASDVDEGDTPTWSIVTTDPASPAHGEASVDANGVVTYTPDADYNGADSFTVQVADRDETYQGTDTGTDTIVVNVTIEAVEDAPVITNDAGEPYGDSTDVTMSEDGDPTAFALTLYASDADGDTPLTWSIVTTDPATPAHGEASIDADGVVSYTPDTNYAGTDSFTVQVADGVDAEKDIDTIVVNVTIEAVNDAPVITDGDTPAEVTMSEDGDPTAFALDLAATDVENDTLIWSIVTTDPVSPVNGEASVDADGVVTYTPAANYNGADSFTVQVADRDESYQGTDTGTDTITVNVTIEAVNDAPTPGDDTGSTPANSVMTTVDPNGVDNLFANDTDIDGDALTRDSFDATSAMGAAVNVFANGQFSYDPRFTPTLQALCSTQSVEDSFTYSVKDTSGVSATATVTVTVTGTGAGNCAPTGLALSNDTVAENQDPNTPVGSFSTTDPDTEDSHTYTLVAGNGDTDNGQFQIVAAELQTTATFDFETKSSYSVRVRTADLGGKTFEKALTITVTDENEAPSFTSEPVTEATDGEAYSYNVTATDPDTSDELTIEATLKPDWLTLTANGNGAATLSGTPAGTDVGEHSVTLQVTDGAGGSAEQSFTVTVAPVSVSGAASTIATGHDFSLALRSDGTVVGWGNNGNGQTTIPAGLTGVQAITAGTHHSLALKSDGTVVGWGYNGHGATNVPAGLSGVQAIASGGYHNLALKSDGTVVGWGYNNEGQTNVPAGLSGVQAIAVGGHHSLALKSDGTVVGWGYNAHGETTIPAGLSGVQAIAAGWHHSLALKSDGTVVAWGYNGYGQTTIPAGLTGVQAITAGVWHSLALKSDGTVVAWGYNDHGATNVPAGLTGVQALAKGVGYHNLVQKSDGTVVAWGYNSSGQTNVPAEFQ